MMNEKFNLFFATGSKQYLEFLLVMNVKNILISYAYPDPWDLKPIMKRNNVNLLCDSGAFTAWNGAYKKKAQEIVDYTKKYPELSKQEIEDKVTKEGSWKKLMVDREKYLEFVLKHQDIITRVVNLDVIPGEQGKPVTEEQNIQAAEEGWENYLWFLSKGINTVHVYHYGEDFSYLDRMINFGCDYIGISPSNDLHDAAKMQWLDQVFRHIDKSANPKIKTHGFGVTSKKLVERYPWYSCDSSSYSLTSAMGGILTPWGRVYVSDQNHNDPDHIINKHKMVQDHIDKYLSEGVGYNIKHMIKNVEEVTRECVNCFHPMNVEEKAVSYKPRNFANILYFLKMEERVLKNGPTMDYQKQLTLF